MRRNGWAWKEVVFVVLGVLVLEARIRMNLKRWMVTVMGGIVAVWISLYGDGTREKRTRTPDCAIPGSLTRDEMGECELAFEAATAERETVRGPFASNCAHPGATCYAPAASFRATSGSCYQFSDGTTQCSANSSYWYRHPDGGSVGSVGDSWQVDAGVVVTWDAYRAAAWGLPDGGSFWRDATVAEEVRDAGPQKLILPASAGYLAFGLLDAGLIAGVNGYSEGTSYSQRQGGGEEEGLILTAGRSGVALSLQDHSEHVLELYGADGEVLAYVDLHGDWVTVHGGLDAGSSAQTARPLTTAELLTLGLQSTPPAKRWISAADAQGDCLDRYPAETGLLGGWVQNESVPGYFELEGAGPYGWERARVCDPTTAHARRIAPAGPLSAPPIWIGQLAMFIGVVAALGALLFLIIEGWLAKSPRPDPVQSVPTVEEQKVRDGEPIGGKPKGAS